MAGKRSDEQFSYLTVKDNVIDTGPRTISIRNISTVGISRVYPHQSSAWLCAVIAIIFFISGINIRDGDALYLFSVVLFILSGWLYNKNETFLVISTNDSTTSLFYNKDMAFMKRVKAAIDDRINNPNDAGQFTVNFNKGSIKEMSVDNMGGVSNMSAETVVSDSPGARIASHSPSAQVGDANTMEVNTSYVNYETYLPHVEKIRQAVPARRPDLNIEDKLDELIDLMKKGSPTNEDKSRVEQLALNLAQVLQGYPPMVRLFKNIVSLIDRFT